MTTEGPTGKKVKYRTYNIDVIHAVDKNGKPVILPAGPAIEMRITDASNKRSVVYFDLMRFDGKNIVASQSRLIPSIKKTIPISSVKTIEVQNGGKRFRYVK